MKYIYFDCYAGFDVQMALGSLIDMSENKDLAKKAGAAVFGEVTLFTQEVKRQSMEALLAYFDFPYPDEQDIGEFIEKSELSEEIKTKLRLWNKVKSDGRKHNFIEEIRELACCAACLELIDSIGADEVYVSAIYQGAPGGNAPSDHTRLLCKMADILTYPAPCEKEILTPGGAALLYVLGAKHMGPGAHDVIKSGYGAGEEILSMPNIVRCIFAGKNDLEELNLNFEALISDMCAEIAALAKTGK